MLPKKPTQRRGIQLLPVIMDETHPNSTQNQVMPTAAANIRKNSLRESCQRDYLWNCLRDCLSNCHELTWATARGPRLYAAAYKCLSSTTMSQDISDQSVDMSTAALFLLQRPGWGFASSCGFKTSGDLFQHYRLTSSVHETILRDSLSVTYAIPISRTLGCAASHALT